MFCKCLSDFALKVVMQSKQYKRLEATVLVEYPAPKFGV